MTPTPDHPLVLHGDCLDKLAELDDDSVDAIVTDPPYGLGFMGHEWDQPGPYAATSSNHGGSNVSYGGRPHPAMEVGRYDLSPTSNRRFQQWCEAWAVECLRVLKPGGHLAAFGGTRTYHRLTSGIEDAGFEIRDCLVWLYGSGFPKSLDVSKAIDRAAGVDREPTGEQRGMNACLGGDDCSCFTDGRSYSPTKHAPATAPATEDAQRWDGWGTALKPAHEPIVLARKPLAGTVAGTVLEHGTGALHIDACRIATGDDLNGGAYSPGERPAGGVTAAPAGRQPGEYRQPTGRFPANVLLDEAAADELDRTTGVLTSGKAAKGGHRRNTDKHKNAYGPFEGHEVEGDVLYGDRGGASRFFYTAKASKADRGEGNTHPTVKPTPLMRWLVRLITPPGGLVVDLFAGSGTTGVACVVEGFPCVLIEREPCGGCRDGCPDYVGIIHGRLDEPIPRTLL